MDGSISVCCELCSALAMVLKSGLTIELGTGSDMVLKSELNLEMGSDMVFETIST